MLEENKKKNIYQWEEYTRMLRKMPKTGWRGLKYIKLKNLTVYFLLMKTLLRKENSKLYV
jgi:hypothetical protein